MNRKSLKLRKVAFWGLIPASVIVSAVAIAGPGGERFPVSIADVESKTAERFATLDVDESGSIDLAEFEAANHRRHGEQTKPGAWQKGAESRPRHERPRHSQAHKQMRDPAQRQAMRAAVAEETFTILDSNGDGVISKAEHQNNNPHETRSLAHKRAMFKHLDQDQDQLLTFSEMPNPAERLRPLDADADGLVTKAEMRAAHAQRHGKPAVEAG